VTGDTTWLSKKDWTHFCDYEDGLNEVIGNKPLAILCTYPLTDCGAPQILDVVRTHQFVLARRRGHWDVVETAALKRAKADIKRLNEELEQRVIERTSELMKASEALRQSETELAHVNRITAMGELAASIVHETMQPISGAVINAHTGLRFLSADQPNLEQVRHALDRIVADSTRASDVIAKLRALSKKAPQQMERLDVNDTIRDVIAMIQGQAMRNGVSVHTHFTENLPPIEGDRVQLQQVVLNLFINAVEAMSGEPEGARDVLIGTANDAPGAVVVSVRDSGPGISPESVDNLFDSFYTTKARGMGMGLSICRTIVEAHGGRIWASPPAGTGATIQFTLPVA
jgi:C4-dicarboxylate-specific signal transduction histidine kinase